MGDIYTVQDAESVRGYVSSILCDMLLTANRSDSESLISLNAPLTAPAKSTTSASSMSAGLRRSARIKFPKLRNM
jgi:hypothetical protein